MAPKNTRTTMVNKAKANSSKVSDDSCLVPGCTAISQRFKIALFSMAFGDLGHWWRSTAWVNKYQSELPANALICEVHFEERFIDRTRKKPRLFPGTVPTLQLGVLELRHGADEKTDFNALDYFCRLCAKKEDQPMRHRLNQLTDMSEVVACCLGVYQKQKDLPTGVCTECITAMRQFDQFVKKCDKSQFQLLKIGSDEKFPEDTVEDKENTAKNTEFESVDLSQDADEADPRTEQVQIEKVKQRCIRCDMDFTSLAQYRNHLKTSHREEGYVCQICNKKFAEKRRLRFHLEKVHENRRFKCPDCKRMFNWQYALTAHMKTHQYTFKCDHCWRTFPNEDKLADHRLMHNEDKLFKCLDCGAKFRLKWRLDQHKARVHGVVLPPRTVPDQQSTSVVEKYDDDIPEEKTTATKLEQSASASSVEHSGSQMDIEEAKVDLKQSE